MEGFSNTLCLGLLLVAAIIVLYIVMRRLGARREPPAGTYDSPDFDSGGSIGRQRGGRAVDSEEFDSGASIGAPDGRRQRSYDAEQIDSGASIGGGPRVEERPAASRPPARSRTVSDGWDVGEVSDEQEPEAEEPHKPYRTRKTGKKVDSPDFDSGGSFGG